VLLLVVTVLGPVHEVGPLGTSVTKSPGNEHKDKTLVPTSRRNDLGGLPSIINWRFVRIDNGLIGIGRRSKKRSVP